MKEITLSEFINQINKRIENASLLIGAEPFEDDDGPAQPKWYVEFMGTRLFLPIETSAYWDDSEFVNLQKMAADLLIATQRINPRIYEKAEKFMRELFDDLNPESGVGILVKMDSGYRFSHVIIRGRISISVAEVDEIASWMEHTAKQEISSRFLDNQVGKLVEKAVEEYRDQINKTVSKHGYTVTEVRYGGNTSFWINIFMRRDKGPDRPKNAEFKYSYPIIKIPFTSHWVEHSDIPEKLAQELYGLITAIKDKVEKEAIQIRLKMLELGVEPFIPLCAYERPCSRFSEL